MHCEAVKLLDPLAARGDRRTGRRRAEHRTRLPGRIVDEAGLIKSDDLASIAADLKALEAKSSDQLVVYTTPTNREAPSPTKIVVLFCEPA